MKKKRRLAVSFMLLGVLLVTAAASLFLYNRWEENRASQAAVQAAQGITTLIHAQTPDQTPVVPPSDPAAPDTQEEDRPPTILYDGKNYLGILSVPALDLSLPVMELWSYPKLKVAPCRYTGDPRNDDMVVMAHNYRQHFGNLSLLQYGDSVTFVDAAGMEYRYEVAEIETVNSDDIEGMVESEYDLTLFTCTYSGQARVAVRCIRVSDSI